MRSRSKSSSSETQEAADGAQALGEGADDEVDVGLDAGRLGQAAAVLAQHAHGVGLVDQQVGAHLAS